MTPPGYFTRADFLRGQHCRRLLWLQRQHPDAAEGERASRWGNGAGVAALARTLFPGGVDLGGRASSDPDAAALATRDAIAAGHTVLFDAAFVHHGFFATVDILLLQNDRWQAIEVKTAGRVKGPHLLDASFCWFVITGAGLRLGGFSLMHLDPAYVRQGALEPERLFRREPVTKRIRQQEDAVRRRALMLRDAMSNPSLPDVEMAGFCRKPEPCVFYKLCTELAAEALEADAAQAALEDKQLAAPGVIVDAEKLARWLDELKYPLRFMDFEAYQTPVPEYNGHWAFRPVPFQFSMHRIAGEGGELHHQGFLAEASGETAGPFLEALLDAAGSEGTVLVYNREFENTLLQDLKGAHPHHEAAITSLQARLVDLMVPFKRRWVELPALGDKLSLKQVLPALVPGRSYEGMAIAEGGEANKAFQRLRSESASESHEEVRRALTEYCALDTLAMVLILEKLRQLV